MSTMAFIQARIGSSRLPGKVLEPITGKPMLQRVLERVRAVRAIDDLAIVIPDTLRDEPIRRLGGELRARVFAGSEQDVLDRFHSAAAAFGPDVIVRVTADCPLLDPDVVSRVIELYGQPEVDYAAVATTPASGRRRFPDGLDAEVFSTQALSIAWEEASDHPDREHVTPFIWRQPERFSLAILEAEQDLGRERWTVDYPADLAFVRAVYERLDRGPSFGYRDVLDLLKQEPALREINAAYAGHGGGRDSGLVRPRTQS